MENIDPNNPNLDGDFKALFRIREKRRSLATPTVIRLKSTSEEVDPETVEAPVSELSDDLQQLIRVLHDAAKSNNLDQFLKVSSMLEEKGLTFDHSTVCDEGGKNALHVAMENDSKHVIDHILNTSKVVTYFTAEFQIVVRNTVSQKTCLHILAEKGDYNLTETILKVIPHKKAFLLKETLMEVEGQRPRNFSAIHIAALRGYTNIVDLLHSLGVNVNLINNKHDTPALWAARGNHIETMRHLIQLKADLNHQNDKGSTPLYWAIRYGFTNMVGVLIREGRADIHQQRKLGLVSPVVMAAALGYGDILKLLIKYGADVNTKITNNQTALHFAASNGMDDIIEILLNNHAENDPSDDNGNTPLHLATMRGYVNTMTLLCHNGANIDSRNKFGKTVWNMAMESEKKGVINAVVTLFRRRKRLKGRKLIFPPGRTPLHEAAMLGDIDTIKYLVQEGASYLTLDQNDNTFFHLAARENKVEILQAFLLANENLIYAQNNDGDTSMHLAAERGHLEAVQLLIKKSKLDIKNENQHTPLHKATYSDSSNPTVVKILVETIVKNSNWSLVDAQDRHGNTALHLAAIRNHDELIIELGPMNPSCLNNNGDSPLHAAAKRSNVATLEQMLTVFNQPGKGLNIDQQNGDGETLLHICAKTGNSDLVENLIEAGADLEKRNVQGNTVLHEMAEEIVAFPGCTQKLLIVYAQIVASAPIWWCIKHDLPQPDIGSDVYLEHQRTTLTYLISEVFNHDGYNVMSYCAKIGALGLFEKIMNTDNVCRLSTGKRYVFDITNVTPDTVKDKPRKKKISAFSKASSAVGVINDDEMQEIVQPLTVSYLDIITNMSDEVLATKFLDVTPIKQISENLFSAYQWIYIILLIIQIVYMSCLASYGIPCISIVFNTTTESVKHANPPTVFPFVLFLIWPFLILLFGIFITISRIRNYVRNSRKKSKSSEPTCHISEVPSLLIEGFFHHLSEITAWLFSIFVITWYALYLLDDKNQAYILSVVMILGWMFSIVFTKGFQTVHAFSTMLSYIIIRDVTRFVVIYMFVLLAFAFALHSLFQIPVSVAEIYYSPWETLFVTFNLMLGMAEVFDSDFDKSYEDAGSSSTYTKVVYLAYMILATVILLNLLIAMLSDTYNDIKSREGTTWRVRSVQMAIQIERWFPALKKLAIKTGIVDFSTSYDNDSQRWLLTLPGDVVIEDKAGNVSEITKGLQRMEERMVVMQNAYGDLNNRLENMMDLMLPMLEQQSGQIRPKSAGRRLQKRRSKSVLNV